MSPPRLGNVPIQWHKWNSNHFFCMFKHKRRRPHPRPLPAVSLLPSFIMKRSFPGNKTPWSRTRAVAVEVEEFPPHPAVIAVHLQYCKYCFPCGQEGGGWWEWFSFSFFVGSGPSGAPQQNIEPGAELVFQHHWIWASWGLSGSLADFPGNVIPVGSLALVASFLWPWRGWCGAGVAVSVHVGCFYSSKQYFLLLNCILQSSHPSKILLF